MPRFGWAVLFLLLAGPVSAADGTRQLLGGPLRSGNAPQESLARPLGLVGAVPLTDGMYASPVVADGRVYVVDGSGVVTCLDAATLEVRWTYRTRGGPGNCNNTSSPAIVDRYLHVGTMAGYYYVLSCDDGALVRETDCREPILSAPVVGSDRVYFATLGARVFAVEADGAPAWSWDFVKEVVGFDGDRWSGEAWLAHRKDRVTWRDHFVSSRDLCLIGKTLVVPAGGRTVFLNDAGESAQLRAVGEIPDFAGAEYPATFGQSADEAGNVYVQWHRRDNVGRVEVMRLVDGKLQYDFVKGTETAIHLPGLLSFASVSVRGEAQ